MAGSDDPDEDDSMLDLRPLPARLADMSRRYTHDDPELAALLMEARAHVKHAKIHITELRNKLYGEKA
jgi:hypothetical protein